MAVFGCEAETSFYARCLELLVFKGYNGARPPDHIAEFGSGSGDAVVAAMAGTRYAGTVHGIEIDEASFSFGRRLVHGEHLEGKYTIELGNFFLTPPEADCLIGNPPYLPRLQKSTEKISADDRALLDQCCGGQTGAEVSQRLLSLEYKQVMLLISSYSNPLEIINAARQNNYALVAWLGWSTRLGRLGLLVEPAIRNLQEQSKAFLLSDSDLYLLCGVLWSKSSRAEVSAEERLLVTSLENLSQHHSSNY